MSAVSDAALLLGAFHAAARHRASLDELVAYLDQSVSWGLAEAGGGRPRGIVHHGHGPGHPGPARPHRHGLLRAPAADRPARRTADDAGRRPPRSPLGLGALSQPRYHIDSYGFAPGDLLLLYTDGVTEARDGSRAFYPLAERITGWPHSAPETFIDRFRDDLMHHVGGHLDDDAAMIAIGYAGTLRSDRAGVSGDHTAR